MMWNIPKMWEGGECWIIGGGPSIPLEFGVPDDVIEGVVTGELPMSAYSPYLSPIHGKHIIGINSAYKIGDWMDIIFFGDADWYWTNRKNLAKYGKIQVTCNPNLGNNRRVLNVKFTPRDGKYIQGLSKRPNRVSWNGNSGACAINLAYHLGVQTVYLLGFDMTMTEKGRTHCHSDYNRLKGGVHKPMTFGKHKPSFPIIAKDARKLKLQIYNVSQMSAIEEFKKVKLSEVL